MVQVEKLLLLMPSFMEYEKSLQDQLEKKYEVTLLNCDQYDKVILEEYKNAVNFGGYCENFFWQLRNMIKKERKLSI